MKALTQLTFPSFSCVVHQEAKNGRACCGDSYYVDEYGGDYFVVAIADGLGSGLEARSASEKAISLVHQRHYLPVTELISHINTQLFGTRGVVFAVVKFFPQHGYAEFSGVGNIVFTLYASTGKRTRMLSLPGYLDGRRAQIRKERFAYTLGDRFVMYSDGIVPRAEWADVFQTVNTPLEGLNAIRHMWKAQNDDITVIVGG